MLAIPTKGFQWSVNAHNVDLDLLLDWIEGSALLQNEEVSQIDVADRLIEEEVYENQDFALEWIANAWVRISERQSWLGRSRPLLVSGDRISPRGTWSVYPDYSFCLLLGLRAGYQQWTRELDPDFREQGVLFESLAHEALQRGGWKVIRTGWAGIDKTANQEFEDLIEGIANALGELRIQGVVIQDAVKDAGLDLVAYWPFADARGGNPALLVQCASGANWQGKLGTPRLPLWSDLIRFSTPVGRGMVVPFYFSDRNEFRRFRLSSEGVLLDRYRILEVGREDETWLSPELGARLVDWLRPQISYLLSLEN